MVIGWKYLEPLRIEIEAALVDCQGVYVAGCYHNSPDATVGEAAGLILEHKIGGLPVVENSRLVGMITETGICYSYCNWKLSYKNQKPVIKYERDGMTVNA